MSEKLERQTSKDDVFGWYVLYHPLGTLYAHASNRFLLTAQVCVLDNTSGYVPATAKQIKVMRKALEPIANIHQQSMTGVHPTPAL